MNVFILILYTFALFSVSQGGIGDWWDILWGGTKNIFFDLWNRHPASRSLYKYLDVDVKPCDNFYKFACGKWIRTKELEFRDSKWIVKKVANTNFDIFRREALKGKYNDESPAIHTYYKLHEKCEDLSGDESEECKQKIMEFGVYALSSLFIKKNMIKNEYNKTFDLVKKLMFDRIKEEFKLLIDEKHALFDEETRKHYLHKLKTMKFKKNFDLYDISNVELMEECYKKTAFLLSKPKIKTILSDLEFQKNKLSKKHKKFDLSSCEDKIFYYDEFFSTYVTSNGAYSELVNIFIINSDALNEPSFSKDFPTSLNYGGLGFTIAHEILHGFDNKNDSKTIYGDNKNEFEITEKSNDKFKEKKYCFVEQYGEEKHSLTDKKMNGSMALAENIADNGGIKIAHRAYIKWLKSNGGKDIEVPAFKEYTNEQLFFIGLGTNFCEYITKDELERNIETDEHSPGEIRLNVLLSNYKPFSDAFNCPVGSGMNSKKRCEVWKNH